MKIAEQKIPRILLLDDESEIVNLCADVLRDDYHVVKTNSPFEGISLMDAGRNMIDLVICDYAMPGMNGSEFVHELRSLGIRTPAILYTGRDIREIDRPRDGFIRVLEKPFRPERLLEEVHKAVSSIREDELLHQKFRGILTHLDVSIDNLERVLQSKKNSNFRGLSPETALGKFGQGDDYNIFMAWFYLFDLRNKIEKRN